MTRKELLGSYINRLSSIRVVTKRFASYKYLGFAVYHHIHHRTDLRRLPVDDVFPDRGLDVGTMLYLALKPEVKSIPGGYVDVVDLVGTAEDKQRSLDLLWAWYEAEPA